MTAAACLLYPEIEPPEQSVLRRFCGIPASCVSDAQGRTGAAVGLVPLSGVDDETHIVGPALTVRTEPGDNLVVHRAADLIQPGDILVVDAGGTQDRAIAGGLLLRYAASRGAAAVVIDGTIRDLTELGGIDLPVYARGVCPHGPHKAGSGEIRGRISVGGAIVHQGDVIIGDRDGVVVVAADLAEDVAREAHAIAAREAASVAAIDTGEWNRPWVDSLLVVPATTNESTDK